MTRLVMNTGATRLAAAFLVLAGRGLMRAGETAPRIGATVNRDIKISAAVPSSLIALGILLLVGLTFALYFRIFRTFATKNAWVLIFLRTLAIVALFLTCLQPTLTYEEVIRKRLSLLTMIDTSKSMSLKDVAPSLSGSGEGVDPGGKARTRIEAVSGALTTSAVLTRLRKRFDVRLFGFGATARRVAGEPLAQADDEFTDIVGSIRAAMDTVDENLGGILLFTDGADNSGVPTAEAVERLGLPVYAVGVGSAGEERESATRDVEVAGLSHKREVRVGNIARIDVTVINHGFEKRLPIILLQGSEEITRSEANLIPSQKRVVANLEFTPAEEGTFTYTVRAPADSAETSSDNNEKSFTLVVKKRATAVLVIAGEAGWEYKFLKRTIEEDPQFELVALLRLGPETVYRQGTWDEEKSLDLADYDVLILANIERDFFSDEQLAEMKRSVDELGHALVMLGGHNSFGLGGYQGTPLEKILPVQLEGRDANMIDDDLSVVLSDAAISHQMFQLHLEPEKNRGIWKDLSRISGANPVPGTKPGASAMLLGLRDEDRAESQVLIALQRYGKGRTLAIATNSTWKWRGTDTGRACYSKFWGQALRWLSALEAPTLEEGEHLKFWTDKEEYSVGDEVRLEATVIDRMAKLTSTAEVEAELSSPDGHKSRFELISSEELGRYLGTCALSEQGTYSVTVRARTEGFLLGEASKRLAVGSTSAEFDDPDLNEPLLRAIANRTNGAYLSIAQVDELPARIKLGDKIELKPVKRELWSNPIFLGLFVALITTEWVLRKRMHMV